MCCFLLQAYNLQHLISLIYRILFFLKGYSLHAVLHTYMYVYTRTTDSTFEYVPHTCVDM